MARRLLKTKRALDPEIKKKRRFWQIHLSTGIVLMFVAGGLLWANLARHEFTSEHESMYFVPDFVTKGVTETRRVTLHEGGWPWQTFEQQISITVSADKKVPGENYPYTNSEPGPLTVSKERVLLNIGAGIVILFVCACICEYFARAKTDVRSRKVRTRTHRESMSE